MHGGERRVAMAQASALMRELAGVRTARGQAVLRARIADEAHNRFRTQDAVVVVHRVKRYGYDGLPFATEPHPAVIAERKVRDSAWHKYRSLA